MKKNQDLSGLAQCFLFQGIGKEEQEQLLVCMEGIEKECGKQEMRSRRDT